MYVCGPTVYSNVHLGNVRTFMSFDMVFRYLKHLGYKVRYVRNITDAGHLEDDADTGEDKITKKARLEQIEPMEVVQRYTVDFHNILNKFNFYFFAINIFIKIKNMDFNTSFIIVFYGWAKTYIQHCQILIII